MRKHAHQRARFMHTFCMTFFMPKINFRFSQCAILLNFHFFDGAILGPPKSNFKLFDK